MKADIIGIGIMGPGLEGWDASRAVLRGEAAYDPEGFEPPPPELLSSRERRRSGPAIRLALGAGLEAASQSGQSLDNFAAVFGTSGGNGREVHSILSALCEPEMLVSPTHFHNSVHNSAVGYWCIATGCHKSSTSVAAYDYTFAAALLKAVAQVTTERQPVLLAVLDCAFPEPLNSKRPIDLPFAVSLALAPAGQGAALARLELAWRHGAPNPEEAPPRNTALEFAWRGNPAGRALPLFEALARGEEANLVLRYPDSGRVEIGLTQ